MGDYGGLSGSKLENLNDTYCNSLKPRALLRTYFEVQNWYSTARQLKPATGNCRRLVKIDWKKNVISQSWVFPRDLDEPSQLHDNFTSLGPHSTMDIRPTVPMDRSWRTHYGQRSIFQPSGRPTHDTRHLYLEWYVSVKRVFFIR